jgi:predicted nuclease of predicted toxin-antitoxin system
MANLLERITINADQCGGRPCIRGMRIRVTDVLDLFAAGLNAKDKEIFESARQEKAVVMTKDSDFVLLLDKLGPPPQVIFGLRAGIPPTHA